MANSGPQAIHRYLRAMDASPPQRVAVLVLPTVIPLELGTVTEVFGRDPHYDLTVCAESQTSAVSGSGFTINTSAGLDAVDRAETVVVPGFEDVDGTVSTIVLDTLQSAHARGARLVSICTGAFALAAAGILDDAPPRRTGDGPTICSAATRA